MKNHGTIKEYIKTANLLASNPIIRKQTEEEIRKNLPEGTNFHINNSGFGQISTDIYISNGKE